MVGGLVTPDTITVEKTTGKVTAYETAEKEVMTVRVGGGTEEQPVPAHLRSQPVLDNHAIASLVQPGKCY